MRDSDGAAGSASGVPLPAPPPAFMRDMLKAMAAVWAASGSGSEPPSALQVQHYLMQINPQAA